MMTSSNGNIFRATSSLYGEITSHRWTFMFAFKPPSLVAMFPWALVCFYFLRGSVSKKQYWKHLTGFWWCDKICLKCYKNRMIKFWECLEITIRIKDFKKCFTCLSLGIRGSLRQGMVSSYKRPDLYTNSMWCYIAVRDDCQCHLLNDTYCTSMQISMTYVAMCPINKKSALVQMVAWCRSASSHPLNQCCLPTMTPYCFTRPH